jgi:hypothetical protein
MTKEEIKARIIECREKSRAIFLSIRESERITFDHLCETIRKQRHELAMLRGEERRKENRKFVELLEHKRILRIALQRFIAYEMRGERRQSFEEIMEQAKAALKETK